MIAEGNVVLVNGEEDRLAEWSMKRFGRKPTVGSPVDVIVQSHSSSEHVYYFSAQDEQMSADDRVKNISYMQTPLHVRRANSASASDSYEEHHWFSRCLRMVIHSMLPPSGGI